MLLKSTLQLLRFHFSFFLMPVYWFALSQITTIAIMDAILIFVILHLLIYPASNGYNSYMDRDEGSIGGIEKPLAPTQQLFCVSVVMDIMALALSLIVSFLFAAGILLYILASRAYSYRGIRLKKFPIIGYVTVVLCQGSLCFFLVKHGASVDKQITISLLGLLSAALLIGGFYPLTQIYQHKQDAADGVTTISALLGIKGSFIFTAVIYFLAMCSLGIYFALNLELDHFFIFTAIMLPVLVYFFWWMRKVYKNESAANFKYTMRMNVLASFCSNAAFITILMLNKF